VDDNAFYWDFVALSWLPVYFIFYWFSEAGLMRETACHGRNLAQVPELALSTQRELHFRKSPNAD
jgi:hypothetical protein